MPIKVVSRYLEGSDDVFETLRRGHVVTESIADWQQQGDVWVPTRIRTVYYGGANEVGKMYEMDLRLKWMVGEEKIGSIPEVTDNDWREAFVKLGMINEDWTVDFPEDE